MLLYLYVICDNSRRWCAENTPLHPAGVLYHPVTDLVVKQDAADQRKARLQLMQMDGVVLNDTSVVLAMEEEPDKVFIPAGLNKDGRPTGSVITETQFIRLRGIIEELLVNMARTLLAGDIAALPLQNDTHDACKYCDYRAVCARDGDDPVRPFDPPTEKEMLQSLDEEVNDDGNA